MTIAAIILGLLSVSALYHAFAATVRLKQAERDLADERFDNAQLRERLEVAQQSRAHLRNTLDATEFKVETMHKLIRRLKQSARTRKPNRP